MWSESGMIFVNENLEPVYQGVWTYENIQYPPSIFTNFSDKELGEVGLFKVRIQELPTPEDKYLSHYEYSWEDDKVIGTPVFKDTPVPEQVSVAQGQAILLQRGLYQPVLDFIESLEGEQKLLAEIAFNKTTHWSRNSPFLSQAASYLDLSENDLDQLFRDASKLVM